MDNTPNSKQWKRIKQRVSEIVAEPTEVKYFYDHYWYPYRPLTPYYSTQTMLSSGYTQISNSPVISGAITNATVFDSGEAFNALGKADALAIQ